MDTPQPAQQTGQIHDSNQALEQVFSLLKSKDDTQRFVGLTLLRTMLDNSAKMQKDTAIVIKCWNAIPSRFLDRLFVARSKAQDGDEQAKAMTELAVALVHAFVVLLPQDRINVLLPQDMSANTRASWLKRIDLMIATLPESFSDIQLQILQILYSFSCALEGAAVLLEVKNWNSLLKRAVQEDLVRNIFKHTYLTLSISASSDLLTLENKVLASLDRDLAIIVAEFKNVNDTEVFFSFLNELMISLPYELFQSSPTWLAEVTKQIYRSIIRRRSDVSTTQTTTMLTATLLHVFPKAFPELLFDLSSLQDKAHGSKPLPYLFVKLILVDIRSTIPSLQDILNSPEYDKTSARLAASYDILSAFTAFLMRSLGDDDEAVDEISQKMQSLSLLPPDLLLQLRVDISEVMSLTIEHLRDRYDASSGGAAGLHPMVRSAPPMGPGTPAAIAWDTTEGMTKDSLTLSQMRALALWIRDDEGDTLRKEAAGITDVLINLYCADDGLDFKHPITMALEGICATSEGVYAFLSENGWEILVKDLRDVASSNREYDRGIQIIQVLLAVLDSDETGPTKEDWMSSLSIIISMNTTDFSKPQFMLALLDLGYELLAKAPPGLRRRYAKEASKVLSKAQVLSDKEDELPPGMSSRFEEMVMAFEDVMPIPDD